MKRSQKPAIKLLPYLLSLSLGSLVVLYLSALLISELLLGRPNSTVMIGLFFIPIYGLIVAIIGLLIGFLLVFINKIFKLKWLQNVSKSNLIKKVFITFIISAILLIGLAVKKIVDNEKYYEPRVLFTDTEKIKRTALSSFSDKQNTVFASNMIPITLWKHEHGKEKNDKSFLWNNIETYIELSNSSKFILHKKENKTILEYDTSKFDYITQIDAALLPTGKNSALSYLVLFVKLRSSSHRSIILIYNPNYKLIHEELIENCSNDNSNIVDIVKKNENYHYSFGSCQEFTYSIKNYSN